MDTEEEGQKEEGQKEEVQKEEETNRLGLACLLVDVLDRIPLATDRIPLELFQSA